MFENILKNILKNIVSSAVAPAIKRTAKTQAEASVGRVGKIINEELQLWRNEEQKNVDDIIYIAEKVLRSAMDPACNQITLAEVIRQELDRWLGIKEKHREISLRIAKKVLHIASMNRSMQRMSDAICSSSESKEDKK